MRESLLDVISKARGMEEAVILTHNIDFLFLQSMVMEALRRCGAPKLTVLADSGCAHESYADQRPYIEGLGVRFRVVPVRVQAGFRFHPKAVLLSGEKAAHLYVGSGNLGYGGWIDNAETWTHFDAAADGSAAFTGLNDFIQDCLQGLPLAERVGADVARAVGLAERLSGEAGVPARSHALLARSGRGPALLEQMAAQQVPAGGDLYVCSPYFDLDGHALQRLQQTFAPRSTTVLYHPLGSTFSQQVLIGNKSVEVRRIAFERAHHDAVRKVFCHAKFYAIVSGEEAFVFSGSANCSAAALLLSGDQGNAELLVARRMPADEFQQAWLGEFVEEKSFAEIPLHPINQDPPTTTAALRVMSATVQDGRLRVDYEPATATIGECHTNQGAVSFDIESGNVGAAAPNGLRWVKLVEEGGGRESAEHWVDFEEHLALPPRRNPVAEALHKKARSGAWDCAAWEAVATIFLRQVTEGSAKAAQRQKSASAKRTTAGQVTTQDVFATDYTLPRTQALSVLLEHEQEEPLTKLLQDWFNLPTEPADGTGTPPEGNEPSGGEPGAEESDGDAPHLFRKPKPKAMRARSEAKKTTPLTDADRKRMGRILKRMLETLTSKQFAVDRSVRDLSGDLQLASILLATAQRQGWISTDEFLDITTQVWAAAFVDHDNHAGGWVTQRELTEPDFASAMCSPSLSAALLGWAVRAMNCPPGPNTCLFALIGAVAAARVDWIWWGGEAHVIAEQLSIFLASGRAVDHSEAGDLQQAQTAWRHMLQRGRALATFEESVAGRWHAVRNQLRCRTVEAGDLLWQGGAGFCIALDGAPRTEGHAVQVLWAKNPSRLSQVSAPLTFPVGAILGEGCMQELGPTRQVLQAMIDEMRAALKAPERRSSGIFLDDD